MSSRRPEIGMEKLPINGALAVASSIWIEGEGAFQGHVKRIANKSSEVAGRLGAGRRDKPSDECGQETEHGSILMVEIFGEKQVRGVVELQVSSKKQAVYFRLGLPFEQRCETGERCEG